MLSIFVNCLQNDIRVMMRSRAEWLHPIIFFIIFISLFGIGLGFDDAQLIQITPAVIWIAFLLTSLFCIETLFRSDQEEGIFEQLRLSAHPLWWLMLAKSAAFWLASTLPLILVMPIIGSVMHLSWFENLILILSVLLGSPALTLMGVLGATLTVTLPRSGIFLGLLLLPLYIPVLILGESAMVTLMANEWPIFQLTLLAAISILTITLVPHATAAALRIALNE